MAWFGKKKEQEVVEEAPPINLVPKGAASERDNQANGIMARQSPAYTIGQRVLIDALDRRSEVVLLDYTQAACTVSYMIDGVWHQSAQLDRPTGDTMLAVFKTLAALNINERRERQQGSFGAEYKKNKWNSVVTSQGVPTGEKVLIQFEGKGGPKLARLEDLGMRDKMQEEIKAVMASEKGLILVSSPSGHGFSTTFSAMLLTADRFTRNFAEIQDAAKPDKPVENVPIKTYNSDGGETPMSVLPKLIREYPDIIALRDLVNAETVTALFEQAEAGRLMYGGVQAKDCVEAIFKVLQLKVPPAKLAQHLLAVVNVRVLRVLCEVCKQPFAPPPQTLKQLGIPQGKVGAFYRPQVGPIPPKDEKEEPQICPRCLGIGYRGRTGLFELLVVNEDLRKALAKTPKLDIIQQEARKAGMRTMQEEGVVLVARGVTSLPELLRVMK